MGSRKASHSVLSAKRTVREWVLGVPAPGGNSPRYIDKFGVTLFDRDSKKLVGIRLPAALDLHLDQVTYRSFTVLAVGFLLWSVIQLLIQAVMVDSNPVPASVKILQVSNRQIQYNSQSGQDTAFIVGVVQTVRGSPVPGASVKARVLPRSSFSSPLSPGETPLFNGTLQHSFSILNSPVVDSTQHETSDTGIFNVTVRFVGGQTGNWKLVCDAIVLDKKKSAAQPSEEPGDSKARSNHQFVVSSLPEIFSVSARMTQFVHTDFASPFEYTGPLPQISVGMTIQETLGKPIRTYAQDANGLPVPGALAWLLPTPAIAAKSLQTQLNRVAVFSGPVVADKNGLLDFSSVTLLGAAGNAVGFAFFGSGVFGLASIPLLGTVAVVKSAVCGATAVSHPMSSVEEGQEFQVSFQLHACDSKSTVSSQVVYLAISASNGLEYSSLSPPFAKNKVLHFSVNQTDATGLVQFNKVKFSAGGMAGYFQISVLCQGKELYKFGVQVTTSVAHVRILKGSQRVVGIDGGTYKFQDFVNTPPGGLLSYKGIPCVTIQVTNKDGAGIGGKVIRVTCSTDNCTTAFSASPSVDSSAIIETDASGQACVWILPFTFLTDSDRPQTAELLVTADNVPSSPALVISNDVQDAKWMLLKNSSVVRCRQASASGCMTWLELVRLTQAHSRDSRLSLPHLFTELVAKPSIIRNGNCMIKESIAGTSFSLEINTQSIAGNPSVLPLNMSDAFPQLRNVSGRVNEYKVNLLLVSLAGIQGDFAKSFDTPQMGFHSESYGSITPGIPVSKVSINVQVPIVAGSYSGIFIMDTNVWADSIFTNADANSTLDLRFVSMNPYPSFPRMQLFLKVVANNTSHVAIHRIAEDGVEVSVVDAYGNPVQNQEVQLFVSTTCGNQKTFVPQFSYLPGSRVVRDLPSSMISSALIQIKLDALTCSIDGLNGAPSYVSLTHMASNEWQSKAVVAAVGQILDPTIPVSTTKLPSSPLFQGFPQTDPPDAFSNLEVDSFFKGIAVGKTDSTGVKVVSHLATFNAQFGKFRLKALSGGVISSSATVIHVGKGKKLFLTAVQGFHSQSATVVFSSTEFGPLFPQNDIQVKVTDENNNPIQGVFLFLSVIVQREHLDPSVGTRTIFNESRGYWSDGGLNGGAGSCLYNVQMGPALSTASDAAGIATFRRNSYMFFGAPSVGSESADIVPTWIEVILAPLNQSTTNSLPFDEGARLGNSLGPIPLTASLDSATASCFVVNAPPKHWPPQSMIVDQSAIPSVFVRNDGSKVRNRFVAMVNVGSQGIASTSGLEGFIAVPDADGFARFDQAHISKSNVNSVGFVANGRICKSIVDGSSSFSINTSVEAAAVHVNFNGMRNAEFEVGELLPAVTVSVFSRGGKTALGNARVTPFIADGSPSGASFTVAEGIGGSSSVFTNSFGVANVSIQMTAGSAGEYIVGFLAAGLISNQTMTFRLKPAIKDIVILRQPESKRPLQLNSLLSSGSGSLLPLIKVDQYHSSPYSMQGLPVEVQVVNKFAKVASIPSTTNDEGVASIDFQFVSAVGAGNLKEYTLQYSCLGVTSSQNSSILVSNQFEPNTAALVTFGQRLLSAAAAVAPSLLLAGSQARVGSLVAFIGSSVALGFVLLEPTQEAYSSNNAFAVFGVVIQLILYIFFMFASIVTAYATIKRLINVSSYYATKPVPFHLRRLMHSGQHVQLLLLPYESRRHRWLTLHPFPEACLDVTDRSVAKCHSEVLQYCLDRKSMIETLTQNPRWQFCSFNSPHQRFEEHESSIRFQVRLLWWKARRVFWGLKWSFYKQKWLSTPHVVANTSSLLPQRFILSWVCANLVSLFGLLSFVFLAARLVSIYNVLKSQLVILLERMIGLAQAFDGALPPQPVEGNLANESSLGGLSHGQSQALLSLLSLANNLPGIVNAITAEDSVLHRIISVTYGAVTAASVTSFFFIQLLWIALRNSFVKDSALLRQGKCRSKIDPEFASASQFVGLASFHSLLALSLGTLVLSVVFCLLGLLIEFSSMRAAFFTAIASAAIALLSLTFFTSIVLKLAFHFLIAPKGQIVHSRVFALIDALWTILGLGSGLIQTLARLPLSLQGTLLFAGRLDRPIVPRDVESIDPGYASYWSFVHTYNRHHNMILVSFMEILSVQPRELRKQQMSQAAELLSSSTRIAIFDLLFKPRGEDSPRFLLFGRRREAISRARKRWLLAFTLSRNPQLIPLRAHNITFSNQANSVHLDSSLGIELEVVDNKG